MQVGSQPSPLLGFESSHDSPVSTMPLPQMALQSLSTAFEQCSGQQPSLLAQGVAWLQTKVMSGGPPPPSVPARSPVAPSPMPPSTVPESSEKLAFT